MGVWSKVEKGNLIQVLWPTTYNTWLLDQTGAISVSWEVLKEQLKYRAFGAKIRKVFLIPMELKKRIKRQFEL